MEVCYIFQCISGENVREIITGPLHWLISGVALCHEQNLITSFQPDCGRLSSITVCRAIKQMGGKTTSSEMG